MLYKYTRRALIFAKLYKYTRRALIFLYIIVFWIVVIAAAGFVTVWVNGGTTDGCSITGDGEWECDTPDSPEGRIARPLAACTPALANAPANSQAGATPATPDHSRPR
jgi:hypothetical protein